MESALRERGDDDPGAAHLREAQRVIGDWRCRTNCCATA